MTNPYPIAKKPLASWNDIQDRQYVASLERLTTTYHDITNRLGYRTGQREFIKNALILYGLSPSKCDTIISEIEKCCRTQARHVDDPMIG